VVAIVALGVACADPAADPASDPPVDEVAPTTGPLDALSRRFGRLRNRMRERGYRDQVGFARRLVLEGEGIVVPVDLPTGSCTTFVALGGGTIRSLHLSVYDDAGAQAAADETRGEGGLAHLCPRVLVPAGATSAHYLVVQASEGSGAVVAAAFRSAPGEGEGFDDLFADLLTPVVPFRVVEERLARTRSALRDRGLVPVGEPQFEALVAGERIRVEIVVEEGSCVAGVARGDEGIVDIDLALLDPSGAEVARDLGRDAEPSVELCPEVPGRYVLEASVFEGAGAVGMMVLSGSTPPPIPTEPPDVGDDDLAVVPGAENPDTVEDAEDAVAALHRAAVSLTDRGYSPPLSIRRDGRIGPGEVRTHEILVGTGCAVVLGAAGRGDTDIDLYLTASDGSVIDRDTGVQPTARVRVCTEGSAELLRVVVKAYGRRGTYALSQLVAPREITDVQALRLEEATARFSARGYRDVRRRDRQLDEGERSQTVEVLLPRTCRAWAAAGDMGVEDVDLLLRSGDGQLVASSTGSEPYATVSRCSDDALETLTLEVVAYRGRGSVTIAELEGTP
jgi:hypothetical protein